MCGHYVVARLLLIVVYSRRCVSMSVLLRVSFDMLVGVVLQAEDGIRDLLRSRGLGDVYKRQGQEGDAESFGNHRNAAAVLCDAMLATLPSAPADLSLIHI